MFLENDRKEKIVRSNHRLAIVGLFDPERRGKSFEFSATGEKDGPFTANGLFQALKPKLVTQRGQKVTIGAREFNGYRLLTPRGAALQGFDPSNCQQIAIDSLLLDPPEGLAAIPAGLVEAQAKKDKGVVQSLVKRGQKLFADLVDNLDLLVPFSYSGFSRSLQDLARGYVRRAVAWKEGSELLDWVTWDKRLNESPPLAGALVNYLLCCEPDEPATAEELRAILEKERIYPAGLRANIGEAMAHCRQTLLKEGESSDPVFLEMATWEGWDWLESFGSDPDRGFEHPSLSAGGSFAQYYRVLMKASGEVHRLLRTESIHPQMVIWLASLYVDGNLDDDRLWEAAQKMFALGVAGRSEHTPALPSEVLADLTNVITQAQPKAQQPVGPDEEKTLAAALGTAEELVREPLVASRRFTVENLRKRAENLFTSLGQLVGGALGELLQGARKDLERFVPLLQQLLNLQPSDRSDVARILEEKLPGLFLDAADAADLQETVLVSFDAAAEDRWSAARGMVRYLAVRAKTRIAEGYYRDLQNISQLSSGLRLLYQFRTFAEVESKGKVPGRPMVALGEPLEKSQSAANRRVEEVAAWLRSSRAKTQGQIKSLPPKLLPEGEAPFPEAAGEFPVEVNGRVVASLFRREDQAQLELKVPDLDQLDQVTSGKALVVFPERKIPLLDLGLENIDDLRAQKDALAQLRSAEASKLAGLEARVPETIDRLARIAADRADGPLEREVRGAFRALLLAEHILAAPEGATTLGSDDLSAALALLVDMVEHLAREARQSGEKRPTESYCRDAQNLRRIQLGKLFPVLGAEDLHQILIYHRALGEGLGDADLQRYVAEVRALRALFRSIDTGSPLEILVVNDDLPSFANASQHDYAVLYLTAQGSPVSDPPPAVGEMVNTLARALAFRLSQADQSPVIPLIFTDGLTDGSITAGDALPILDGSTFKIRLAAGFTSGPGIELVVEKPPLATLGLPVGLAAAAAAHLSLDALGSLARPLALETIGHLAKSGLTVPNDGERVVAMLRELWNTRGLPVAANYLLARWLTLAIAARQKTWKKDTSFDLDIAKEIEAVLGALGPGERDDLLALVSVPWRGAEVQIATPGQGSSLRPQKNVQNQSLRCIFGVARPGEQAIEIKPAWQRAFRETLI